MADYGYTDTSLIPMAVDFSFSIEFDAQGNPQIVTDYPFEKTGARQLNVVYNKGDIEEAVTLVYEYPSGKTRINGWNGDLYRDGASFERTIYGEIRSGVLTPADSIYLNTVRNSAETDWVLEYSVSQQRYLSYEEKTHSQGFNAMAAGGISKSLYYWADELDSSRVMIRTDNADLLIDRNRTGDITYASVYQYAPTFEFFDYDPSTGLFGGRSLSDLGFNESQYAENDDVWIVQYAREVNLFDNCKWDLAAGVAIIFGFFFTIAVILCVMIWLTVKAQIIQEQKRLDLTNALAHDIKTPLFVISGYAYTIKEDIDAEERGEYIDKIIEQTDEVNGLVHRMLSYSKLDSYRMKLNKSQFDLLELTESILQNYTALPNGKKLEFAHSGKNIIEADRELLKTALQNLIDYTDMAVQMSLFDYSRHEEESKTKLLINELNRSLKKPLLKRASEVKKNGNR